MRRRDFIKGIWGTVLWPAAARAQQPEMPVVGFLHTASPQPNVKLVSAFVKGLSETGYVESQNLTIEYRWANNDYNRLPELAADLIRRHVNVIACPAATQAALAAKAATRAIPVVFGTGGDPVELGLVASLARPGGNVTGVSFMNVELAGKRLGLLTDLIPNVAGFVTLVNPTSDLTARIIKDATTAAVSLKRPIEIVNAGSIEELDTAFANLGRGLAVMVGPDALFTNRRSQIASLASRHAVPAIYYDRAFVESGGLISYGTNLADMYRQTGNYTGRVLKGEKPADLPVQAPTKYELAINLKTAKALGIDVPWQLQQLADDVIE
jgi:putative ABC transport system substrate-binding protein